MTKEEAIDRLFNEYTDVYGRVTLYKANLSDPTTGQYDSENQGLWTGEAGVLLYRHQKGIGKYRELYEKMMKNVQVEDREGNKIKGLYSRHPKPFYFQPHHNVSKDEYRGFAYGAAVLGKRGVMREIVEYGESNSWFYVDDDPYGGINIDHWGAFRLPSDRFLLKLTAGIKPNVIELLFFVISAWLNSRKPANNTSSKIMSWFGFQVIEILGYESKIATFFRNLFDKNLKKCYNTDTYMEEIFKIYFRDPDHPFHVLIKGLK